MRLTAAVAKPVGMVAVAAASATGLQPWLVAGFIWLGLGLILVVFGLLFVLEAVTYFLQQPHITFYIRSFGSSHLTIVAVVGVGLVASAVAALFHFVVDIPNSKLQ